MPIDDLASLPLSAKLAAMEALWDSLSRHSQHDPSPPWHADVLAKRRLEMDQAIPWDETKRRLRAFAQAHQH